LTLHHFLRTLAVASLGTIALVLASQARAEGEAGDNLIPPDRAAELAEAATAEAAAVVEEASEAPEEKKSTKTAKAADRKKAEGVSAPNPKAAEPGERMASKAAETEPASRDAAGDESQNQTASLPGPAEIKARFRQPDAARAAALKPLIARYASENGLPYELADAVVRLESRYNASARNGPNMGLTQINVRTAQSLGYKGGAAGLLDAETNLRYGLKYLATAYKLAGGDTCGTILRYQFGHRAQTMTGASRAYCAKVKVITAAAE